eukprot:TRINITY_DN11553_c0_g1_i2.p1 TRINITY_DN11553_c0_g1~~TRINITY_DN11553_c0_g1_i2.p1  ORF type:complete len:850 (+),score=153.85 TRINITY_DN11553_c0_g1_i2:85-2634(+)
MIMAHSAGDISTYGAVDWHNFSQWVTCFAVVTFDLEAGQAIECMQPPEACFPAKVLQNIRYLAFPDSNSGLTGDYTYTFRFRNATTKRRTALSAATAAYPSALGSSSSAQSTPSQQPKARNGVGEADHQLHDQDGTEFDQQWERSAASSNTTGHTTTNKLEFCGHTGTDSTANGRVHASANTARMHRSGDPLDCGYRQAGEAGGPKFLYGYVYFRQVPDETNRRGFFQKSVVLVTSRPLSGLFATMAAHLALSYFSSGPAALASACADVSLWPSPKRGMHESVYFLRQPIEIQLPHDMNVTSMLYAQARLTSANIAEAEDQRALDLYLCMEPLLSQIQLLWELVLTSQPVLVISQTPVVTSRFVLALVSIIMPLEYHSDFRPFFTIYDPDCQRYSKLFPSTKSQRSLSEFAGAILGVTNPYFEQAYAGWPTIVRVTSMRGLPAPGRPRRARYGSMSDLSANGRTSPLSGPTSPLTGRRTMNPLSHSSDVPLSTSPLARSVNLTVNEPVLGSLLEDDDGDSDDDDGNDNVAVSQPLHRAASSLNSQYIPMIDSVLGVAAVKARSKGHPLASSAPTSPQRGLRLKVSKAAPRASSAQGPRPLLPTQVQAETDSLAEKVSKPIEICGNISMKKKGKVEGVTSSYRPKLESDHKMIKQLLQCPSDTVEEVIKGGHVLRKSLDKLTRTFMIPLESYFARLMPKLSAVSPLKPCPELAPFNARNFLESLPACKLLLKQTRNGDWLGLYAMFLKSRNFRGWLSLKRQNAQQQLLQLYVQSILDFEASAWASKSSEVEIVDFLIRIRTTLEKRASYKLDLSASDMNRLRKRAEVLESFLSPELQQSLQMSRTMSGLP